MKRKGKSTFIGIDANIALEYTTKNDEETVCHFCPNECKRTCIDTTRPDGSSSRYISGFSCVKRTVESEQAMLDLVSERKKIAKAFPNVVDYEWKLAFRSFYKPAPQPEAGTPIADKLVKKGFFAIRHVPTTRPFQRSGKETKEKLRRSRIGIG